MFVHLIYLIPVVKFFFVFPIFFWQWHPNILETGGQYFYGLQYIGEMYLIPSPIYHTVSAVVLSGVGDVYTWRDNLPPTETEIY